MVVLVNYFQQTFHFWKHVSMHNFFYTISLCTTDFSDDLPKQSFPIIYPVGWILLGLSTTGNIDALTDLFWNNNSLYLCASGYRYRNLLQNRFHITVRVNGEFYVVHASREATNLKTKRISYFLSLPFHLSFFSSKLTPLTTTPQHKISDQFYKHNPFKPEKKSYVAERPPTTLNCIPNNAVIQIKNSPMVFD